MDIKLGPMIVVIWIAFAMYVLVFLAILADLWSGVRKAKSMGKARTSYGLRRTVEKMLKYYNLLIILSIIDCMQIVCVWYLDTYYEFSIPMIPLITIIGAIGIGLIELKSIYEKADDKEIRRITELTGNIISNKDDLKKITASVIEYLKNENTETVGERN